jgi:hypothetical protein
VLCVILLSAVATGNGHLGPFPLSLASQKINPTTSLKNPL